MGEVWEEYDGGHPGFRPVQGNVGNNNDDDDYDDVEEEEVDSSTGWTDDNKYENNNDFDTDGCFIRTRLFIDDGDAMGTWLAYIGQFVFYREFRTWGIDGTVEAVLACLVAEIKAQVNTEDAKNEEEE